MQKAQRYGGLAARFYIMAPEPDFFPIDQSMRGTCAEV
jgi:hypothetical protein